MNPLRMLFGRDLGAFHLRLSGCGGCTWAVDAFLRDREGRGPVLECSSPRHSGLLLVTGLLTEGLAESAFTVIEQAPPDALLVAIGDCALGRGVVAERLKMTLSVADQFTPDIEVAGCPVALEALLRGVEDVTR